MRVNIDEIKEGGLDRAWDLTREQLDDVVRGDRAGYRASAAAHVEAHLEKVSRRVMVEARARAPLQAPCGRCLAPVALQIPVAFSLTLIPADEAEERPDAPGDRGRGRRGRRGGSFDAGEVDEETYAGREIDLDPMVREQVLLALPGYPVCREGCLGLCPVCGQNRNEKRCGCDPHVPDPRWAGLAKFRDQTK